MSREILSCIEIGGLISRGAMVITSYFGELVFSVLLQGNTQQKYGTVGLKSRLSDEAKYASLLWREG
eukprot:scaffold5817_cov77-Skeletonema_menzelii.AAC.1